MPRIVAPHLQPIRIVGHRAETGGWEMALREPIPLLSPYVRAYWGYDEAMGCTLRRREPARAGVTLILSFWPPLAIRMASGDGAARETRHGSFVAGLNDSYIDTRHEGESRGVEVCLTPLGARVLLGIPAGELTRRVVDLDDILGREAQRLSERLYDASCWEERFALLDDRFASQVFDGPALTAAVAAALRQIHDSGGTESVGTLVAGAGCSHRHFIARFREEVGLAPKTVARLVRFSRVRLALDGDTAADWAGIVHRCGYYDQAHLHRDFRAFTGLSPSEFVARRLPDCGGVSGD